MLTISSCDAIKDLADIVIHFSAHQSELDPGTGARDNILQLRKPRANQ